MLNFSDKLNTIAQNTDSYLKSVFSKQNSKSDLIKAMKYGVFSGGKRFRSAIVVNTGKIFGIDYKKLIIIGAAVECIHSYSLIHDDLPSMDNDDYRRGKLSVHKKFNEATAILAGDALHDFAFEILSDNKTHKDSLVKINLVKKLTLPKFPIEGKDVLNSSIEPGPLVGKILQQVEKWWIENDFKPNKKECITKIKKFITT